MKQKSKNKSKSSLRLVTKSKVKFDKTLVAVIAAVVVASGGYLFYKGIHAATIPPASYGYIKTVNFTATDGVKSTNTGGVGSMRGFCMSYIAASSLGNITRCGQLEITSDNGTTQTIKERLLIHSFVSNKYSPDGGWITFTYPDQISILPYAEYPYTCKNTQNSFAPLEYVPNSAVGAYQMGTQYHYASSSRIWQVNFANYSLVTNNCAGSNVWYKIVGTW